MTDRRVNISAYVTPAERDRVRKAAAREDRTVSVFIKRAVLAAAERSEREGQND